MRFLYWGQENNPATTGEQQKGISDMSATTAMSGPEHYQEAERLLNESSTASLAAAQVHATLALAAATALPTVATDDEQPWRLSAPWAEVTT